MVPAFDGALLRHRRKLCDTSPDQSLIELAVPGGRIEKLR